MAVTAQQLTVPVSDQPSGIYTSDVVVTLTHPTPGVTIFYTLNGNEPGPTDFVYTGPLTLSNISGVPNHHSMIPTNPSFNYPMGTYDLTRANNRGWLPPWTEVYKINVIRYRAYKPGYVPSETVTQTIMVDPLGPDKYAVPVLSLVFDSTDLFSNETGIYVYGNHPDGNYTQKGMAWERMANFELFNVNGQLVLEKKVRSRIHGGGSRSSCKKNFRLYADTEESTHFDYAFFENYDLAQFKRIIIRSGGHRPDCFPRDDLANLLTEGLSVDHQHGRHVILFINGEYWGIHTIKERVDKYFIQERHGVDDDDITIIDQEYDVQEGYQVDSDEMVSLENFVMTNDMTIQANYDYALRRIDVDNYIDYMCSEIFLSNEDWVFSNVVTWRKTGPFDPTKPGAHDGRFRWVFYDFDGAFGGSCDNAYYTVNTLNAATVITGLYSSYTRLFRRLLENPGFKKKFVNRMCDLLNSQYQKNRVNQKITELYDKLTPMMMETINRWRYPSTATTLYTRNTEVPSLTQWDLSFYYLHFFANRRQKKVREHMMTKWGYPDTSIVTLNVNDPDMGMVKINTLLVNENLPGVNDPVYPWTGHYIHTVDLPVVAVARPGYRFVEWLETGSTEDTITWNPSGDTLFTAVFEVDPDFLPIRLNEIMASNSGYLFDNFGEDDDWVELYNPNAYSVDLSGCQLQRGTSAWTIPNGTVLSPAGYSISWMDENTYQGPNHASFKLPNALNTIYLKTPGNLIIDSLYYPSATSNYSFGRYPNGSDNFLVFEYPTPERNNDIAGTDDVNTVDLHAWPNPASHYLSLSKPVDFVLFDMHGRQVKSGQNQWTIDIADLTDGFYVLVTPELEKIKICVKK
jgi:hypothetical protein